MNIYNRRFYYLLLLLFPLAFLLHNVNENYGLVGFAGMLRLLLMYITATLCIAFVARLVCKSAPKAYFYAFGLLIVYFLFGVYKDVAQEKHFPALFNNYKFLLPLLLLVLVLTGFYMKRSARDFTKLSQAVIFFLVINALFETGWFIYNVASGAQAQKDFGDYHHTLIRDIKPAAAANKPTVFWIVFDEYANSSTLKRVWNFSNPLDSLLAAKGFWVAGADVRSNYNFTHYSISSILDMTYLKELNNHSAVRLKDLQRGAFSIYDNNVVRMFEKNGYAIYNYSIFPLKNHPTQGMKEFDFVPELLINYQTLQGRLRKDIGWNFPNILKKDKRSADSLDVVQSMRDLDTAHKNLLERCLKSVQATGSAPSFYLFHFMLPHEPYMYRADGSIAFEHGYTAEARYYIPHLQWTNRIVTRLADSILSACRDKNVVVIVQGDHGFRFQVSDPLYNEESCKILYAVYCSDARYAPWRTMRSTVNSFRILFNTYFQTRFPLLPDSSYNLNYR